MKKNLINEVSRIQQIMGKSIISEQAAALKVLKNIFTDFSDDAFRVVWRVGLDHLWFRDPRATEYIKKLSFLSDEWKANGKIFSTYKHDGTKVTDYESLSMYGGTLPFFVMMEPGIANDIYYTKLASQYDQDLEEFKEDIGYYASNWVWFGIAFYEGKLLNLEDIDQ